MDPSWEKRYSKVMLVFCFVVVFFLGISFGLIAGKFDGVKKMTASPLPKTETAVNQPSALK